MEENLILEGLLSMVAELKEKQEKQVIPASREETISRLDVIEQRILEMQNKPAISENTVQEILNQIACIKKRQSGNQKQDLDDIKGMIVTSHRYFKEKLKELFPTDTRQQENRHRGLVADGKEPRAAGQRQRGDQRRNRRA